MSIRDDYTDDEWEKLTPEEQKGLLLMDADEAGEEGEEADIEATGDDDDIQSDLDRLAANDRKAAALAAEQEAAAGEGEGVGEGEGEGEGAGEGEGEGEGAGEGEGQAAAEEAGSASALPTGWNAQLPEDYADRVKANEEAQDANVKAYNDGDISFEEYNRETRRLDRESRKLEKEKDDIELDRKLAQQSVNSQWNGVMSAFMPSHPELNQSQVRMDVFDKILMRVTSETMQKGKMPGITDVNKAYAEWCKEFNFQPAGEGKDTTAPKKTTTAAKPKKKAIKAPPTLGGLPAAQANEASAGRFAQLDRLSGDAFENAFAKLSAEDREAYLQGAG